MSVTRSGYYRYLRRPMEDKLLDIRLMIELKALHKQSKESYGSRRMSQALKANGYDIGRYQARSLMRQYHIECKQRRRFTVTTRNNPKLPVAENQLNRNFATQKPNQVWVADITYLRTDEGWLYLAVVLELFSRRVIGWAMNEHMREELVSEAFIMAIKKRKPKTQLMHHSDRGCQYASLNYRSLLAKHGVIVSMSRKGNCWDNAVMERFFGSLKSERTNGKKYLSRAHARDDVIDYIEHFYNNQRLHSALNYMSPVQYEKQNRLLFA